MDLTPPSKPAPKKRVRGNMHKRDAILAVCGGNQGAMLAVLAMMEAMKDVDPDNFLGDLSVLTRLDEWELYDEEIARFYNDICGGSALNAITLFRATTMKLITVGSLKRAEKPDFPALMGKIKARLPKFGAAFIARQG